MLTFSPTEQAQRALDLWQAGNTKAAVVSAKAILDQVIEPDAAVIIGWLLSSAGESDLAADAYRSAAKQQRLTAEQYAYLGDFAIKRGELAQALADYTAAADLSETYRLHIARTLLVLGRGKEAASELLKASNARISADHARTLSAVATSIDRLSLAELAARRSVRLDRGEAANWFALISAQLALQHPQEATATLHAAQETIPEIRETSFYWYLSSVIEAEVDAPESALAAIEFAVNMGGGEIAVLAHHAAILAKLARYEEAADIYERLLSQGSADDNMLEAAFATFTEAGRHLKALEAGCALLARKPDDERLLVTLHHGLGRRLEFGISG